MLDLNNVQAYEVKWLDGTVLRIKPPTRAMQMTLVTVMEQDAMDDAKASELVYDMCYRILSRHEPVKIEPKGILAKFRKAQEFSITKEAVDNLPFDAAFSLLSDYLQFHYGKLGES